MCIKKKSLSFLPPWEFQIPLSLGTPRLLINLPRKWLSQWSGSFTPRYVTAELLYNTAHALRRYGLGKELLCAVGICGLHPNTPALLLSCSGRVHFVSQRGENTACLLLWLLIKQTRITVSAVPRAPRVSFQPLSSCLACPGFSEQCEQWGQQANWHQEQDQR